MAKINPISSYPVSDDALYLGDLLQRLLDRTVEIFEANGVPLPTRRFWCLGQATEDCEQVAVVYQQTTLGLPGAQQQEPLPCNATRFFTVQLQVTRNYPIGLNGNPPTATQIQESSRWGASDATILIDNLQEYNRTPLGTPGGGVLATVAVAPPSGGVQTTTLTLQLAAI